MTLRKFLPSLLVLLLVLRAAAAVAADVQPSRQCLPEETVLVVRVPEGLAFVDAFRSQTKLGSVLLSNKRFEGVVNLIREQAAAGLTQFTEGLAKYNLKIEDFPKLFEKEVGFALVLESRRDQYPLAIGLTWAEPDSDLGERLLAALRQAVDESKGDADAPRRIDFDIDGQQVIQLTIPTRGPAVLATLDASEFGQLDGEQIKARLEEQRRKSAESKQVDIDQTHVFLTRVGDRLLMANTFGQSETEVRKLLAENPDREIDLATISGLEVAKGIFARFVKAHSGPPAGVTPRIMATPGLAAALPEGVPAVEVLFSPDPLMKLASEAEDGTVARVLKTLGLDRLGPAALRASLDRGALRTGVFLSAPSPREGLLALLDQPTFTGEPPAWVPATVLSYGQLSFDLGKAYTLIRDVVVREGGDQVQNMVDQVEAQVQAFTGADIPTILSAVGQNHYFLSFPPKIEKVEVAEGEEVPTPDQRTGIVWELKDEALWKKLIKLAAGFASMTQGMVEPAEEQGFTGLRIDVEDTFTGGLFVGHGYMVFGIGSDVVEPLLSAVRNPPQGEAALRGGDLMRRAGKLLPAEPGIFYQVTDFDQYLKSMRQTIASLFEFSTSMSGRRAQLQFQVGDGAGDNAKVAADEEGDKVTARLKELLPTDQELEGTAGASVGQLLLNQHGITFRAAVELPPQ